MKRFVIVLLVLLLLAGCTSPLLTEIGQMKTAWSSATTYAKGDYCNEAGTVFQSQQDGNVGHDPAVSQPAWWVQ